MIHRRCHYEPLHGEMMKMLKKLLSVLFGSGKGNESLGFIYLAVCCVILSLGLIRLVGNADRLIRDDVIKHLWDSRTS
jgi:hypothetical protein